MWLLVILAAGVAVAAVSWLRESVKTPTSYVLATDTFVPPLDAVDVGVIRVAVDGRVRRLLETELGRIRPLAPAIQLRETTLLLRRVRDAWLGGGTLTQPGARAEFDRHRHLAGTARQGGEHVLVTIVVAMRNELVIGRISDAEDLRTALEVASHRTDAVACAVACVTFVAADHPELVAIPAALAGKTFCNGCGGPYPDELVSCPHCDAPAVRAA